MPYHPRARESSPRPGPDTSQALTVLVCSCALLRRSPRAIGAIGEPGRSAAQQAGAMDADGAGGFAGVRASPCRLDRVNVSPPDLHTRLHMIEREFRKAREATTLEEVALRADDALASLRDLGVLRTASVELVPGDLVRTPGQAATPTRYRGPPARAGPAAAARAAESRGAASRVAAASCAVPRALSALSSSRAAACRASPARATSTWRRRR